MHIDNDDGGDDPFRTRGLSAPLEPLPRVSTQPSNTNILLSGQEQLVKQQVNKKIKVFLKIILSTNSVCMDTHIYMHIHIFYSDNSN
jgi:hypothetical protein